MIYKCKMISLLTLSVLSVMSCQVVAEKSFVIDYANNTFLKDGEPFTYVSGSMHYSRVPYYYWKDRLDKMFAGGLDAVQTYVPWNVHEPYQGSYDFDGQQDIVGFIEQAQKSGLLVIVRAGPFIDAEWEFGGFPGWILAKNSSIKLRTMDEGYIAYVDKWYSVLLPKLKPLLYANGGPVIMVQIENEYGSYYACDQSYTMHLRDTFRKYLGNNVVYFTTDGAGLNYVKCGAIEGVYATVDFGPTTFGTNVSAGFAPMIQWNKKGLLVNSEFYSGWLDTWGSAHAHTDKAVLCAALEAILKLKASVNMYMFEGGTSFGYMNGADPGNSIDITSYDYDAPLSEAGDITDKYMLIRQTIGKYKKLPQVPIPPSTMKFAYGDVQLSFVGSVIDLLYLISPGIPKSSTYPMSMEEIGQYYGFTLYRTRLTTTAQNNQVSVLEIPQLRDRAHVLLDYEPQGVLEGSGTTNMTLHWTAGQTLDIMVENQGRLCFGNDIDKSRKGITGNVTLGNVMLKNWDIHSLNFTHLFSAVKHLEPSTENREPAPYLPSVFRGEFLIPDKSDLPADTYLQLNGWSKGQAFLNGFNLGRYWPAKGPQKTLYVPYKVLKAHPEVNVIVIVELDYVNKPCDNQNTCKIEFVDKPVLG